MESILVLQSGWPCQLHSRYWNKVTEEALWSKMGHTQHWVTEALGRTSTAGGGNLESGIITSGSCRSVDVIDHQQDPLSWAALISRHTKSGQGRLALQVYDKMRQARIKPSSYAFVAALKACKSLRDMETGKEIHADIVESGFESNKFVGTTLVDFYAKCGSMVDARRVFENMPLRNVVYWNVMILGYAQMDECEEALQLYIRMQQEGVQPDDRTFVAALKACGRLTNRNDGVSLKNCCLKRVRGIHSEVVKKKLESDLFVSTMLVDAYVKSGSLVDARRVFDKMRHRDVVSWNTMILGYALMDDGDMALQLYTRMQQEGVVPNDRTFVGALKGCSSLAAMEEGIEADQSPVKQRCLEQVRAIHSCVMKSMPEVDVFVATMLVDVYAKCGALVDAAQVFEKMTHRDVVSWNAMILSYAQMQEGEAALQLYVQMQQEGVIPDARTFVGALKACCSLHISKGGNEGGKEHAKQQCLDQVKALHTDLVNRGYESDVFVGNMLVDVYSKCGSLVDARCVFDKMPQRTVVTWTAMLLGYVEMEEGDTALQLYSQMQQEGVAPNDRTFVAVLQACSVVAGLEKGKEVHAQILNSGLAGTDPFVASSLIDMYGKCGTMPAAQQVFDASTVKGTVVWNALIAGYARQGESEAVFDLFQRMVQEGTPPDSMTFHSILTVCSHVGLVDKGQKHLEVMSKEYGITPTADHYTCMIDLLGRAGQVDKAFDMAQGMPFQAGAVVWRALLGACQKWGDVKLGRQAFECAVRLGKVDSAAYVLMANIYEAANMWEDAREMHSTRLNAQVRKQPGQSWWTDITGGTHSFVSGDKMHLESQHIYAKLQAFAFKMEEEGWASYLE